MNKETFLQKMHSILKKTGNNCYVVSDDPDCECDFGVDEKNHLIICKAPTFLPVYELEDITYYDDKEMNIEDAYIHFTFKYQTELFLYYNKSHK